MASPIAAGALRIGSTILRGAKTFRRGIAASVDVGVGSTKRTFEKINATNKKIRTENKRQDKYERDIRQEADRREKEGKLERKRAVPTVGGIVKKIIKAPFDAFVRLLAAWAIDNLPWIIKQIQIFVKKLKVFQKSFTAAFNGIGKTLNGLKRIVIATLQNLKEFDFTDNSGRIQAAWDEFDTEKEEMNKGFQNMWNVWSMEEQELDTFLEKYNEENNFRAAMDAIDSFRDPNLDEPGGSSDPQTPAVGPGSGGRVAGAGRSRNLQALLQTISYAEGTSGPDGYNKWFGGRTDMDLSKMTINEVGAEMDRRNRTGENRYGRYASSAVGKYQMMAPEAAARAAGLDPAVDKFTPENQDKMVIAYYLKGQGKLTDAELNGPITPEIIDKLAPVFASFPNLFGPDNRGRVGTKTSYYGQGGKSESQITDYYNESLSNIPQQEAPTVAPQTQAPQAAPMGDSLTDVLQSQDFNTMDRSAPSPIIKTSGRGMRNGRHHGGIDFAPPAGQRGWYCALRANGRVTFVGSLPGYGKTVIIQVGNVDLLFGHLAQYGKGIKNGASYKSGQPIGEIGSTGKSSGIHLHYEARPVGGGGGSDISVEPYVKLLIFGKLNKRVASSDVTMSGNSNQIASATAESLASNRTGNGTTRETVKVIQAVQPVYT